MHRTTLNATVLMAALAGAGCETPGAVAACDGACLLGIADVYLAALAARDPTLAPLADDLAFVENVTRLRAGEGLWASAAGAATAFRIVVPDDAAGTIGLLTVIERDSERGTRAARSTRWKRRVFIPYDSPTGWE